jgi:hypothetical protein
MRSLTQERHPRTIPALHYRNNFAAQRGLSRRKGAMVPQIASSRGATAEVGQVVHAQGICRSSKPIPAYREEAA